MSVAENTLCKALKAFHEQKWDELKTVSEDASREALVHDDTELVDVALIAYALQKLSQKRYVAQSKPWQKLRETAIRVLEACGRGENGGAAHKLLHDIHSASLRLGRFAQSAVDKGRLKVAANMYAHGASLGKAAALSGAQAAEVAAYIGATRIPEKYQTMAVAARMKKARIVLA